MLIHNSVKFEMVDILIKTTIEIQLAELALGDNKFIIANIYMPPSRARTLKTNEFKRVVQNIKNDFPQHHMIIVGDFNIPSARWGINNELQLVNPQELTPMEKRFFNICASYGLIQQNHLPNSRGIFLDLIFSTIHLQNIESVTLHCLLNNNSIT